MTIIDNYMIDKGYEVRYEKTSITREKIGGGMLRREQKPKKNQLKLKG